MKRWKLTYEGSLLSFTYTTETYGDTKEEAISYAVKVFHISRNRIISCELID